jgi:hypothetical protein
MGGEFEEDLDKEPKGLNGTCSSDFADADWLSGDDAEPDFFENVVGCLFILILLFEGGEADEDLEEKGFVKLDGLLCKVGDIDDVLIENCCLALSVIVFGLLGFPMDPDCLLLVLGFSSDG